MELSARLTAVASMVTPGNRVCDVGCDHGYVSIYLVKQKISPEVIAMDVRTGPLSHARENIHKYGLENYIDTRLSDGVDKLNIGEADTLILAGMGGRLMEEILTRGMDKVSAMKELILQPQSELTAFRTFLQKEGFKTLSENMVYEDGKYYPMMRVVPAANDMKQKEADEEFKELALRYGGILLKEQHPILKEYLLDEAEKLSAIQAELAEKSAISEKSSLRLKTLEQEILWNRKALQYYK